MPHALVVDDDDSTLFALAELFEMRGFEATTASTFAAAKAELERGVPDIVLLDVVLRDGNGIDLLLGIPSNQRPYVVLISGDPQVKGVVEQLALKSVQFLRKPIDTDDLERVIAHCREGGVRPSRRSVTPKSSMGLVGSSPAIVEIQSMVERVAATDVPVYIEGESGTGKELVAAAIHACSSRSSAEYVAINCGAIPESLADSELFGHEKGAFTGAVAAKRGVFEEADAGTLFLDELAEMPMELQVRLLRVLETGVVKRVGGSKEIGVDVRIVAATNRPAAEAIEAGKLREDLYHRLCVFPLHLPPLRQRREDVDVLTEHFLARIVENEGVVKTFDDAALAAMRGFHWPGNVRQLRNAIYRSYVLADDVIGVAHLPPAIAAAAGGHGVPGSGVANAAQAAEDGMVQVQVGTSIAEAERQLIEATLEQQDGNKRKAADVLGVSLRTLYNRLAGYEGEARE